MVKRKMVVFGCLLVCFRTNFSLFFHFVIRLVCYCFFSSFFSLLPESASVETKGIACVKSQIRRAVGIKVNLSHIVRQ